MFQDSDEAGSEKESGNDEREAQKSEQKQKQRFEREAESRSRPRSSPGLPSSRICTLQRPCRGLVEEDAEAHDDAGEGDVGREALSCERARATQLSAALLVQVERHHGAEGPSRAHLSAQT